jgi:uncharacterized membrane protein
MLEEVKKQLLTLASVLANRNEFISLSGFWRVLNILPNPVNQHCPFLFGLFLYLVLSNQEYYRIINSFELIINARKQYGEKFYFIVLFFSKLLHPKFSDSMFWLSYVLNIWSLKSRNRFPS